MRVLPLGSNFSKDTRCPKKSAISFFIVEVLERNWLKMSRNLVILS